MEIQNRGNLLWEPLGTSLAIDQRHCYLRRKYHFPCPLYGLADLDTGAAKFVKPGFDLEEIVDPRGLEKIANHPPHHKTDAVKPVMVNAEKAEAIGPATLAELEVAGVIDSAGKIRVLVIDTHRQHMHAALNAARKIGPAFRHRHRPGAARLA